MQCADSKKRLENKSIHYMLYLLHTYRKAQLNIQYYTSHAKRGFTQKDSAERVIRCQNRFIQERLRKVRSATLTRSVNSRGDKGCFRESFFWTFSRDGFIQTKIPINIPVLKRWTIVQSDIKQTDSSCSFEVCGKADLTCVICDKKVLTPKVEVNNKCKLIPSEVCGSW